MSLLFVTFLHAININYGTGFKILKIVIRDPSANDRHFMNQL
jgi:hypothetical protein